MTQLDLIIAWFLLIFAFRLGANLALTRLTFVQLLFICSAECLVLCLCGWCGCFHRFVVYFFSGNRNTILQKEKYDFTRVVTSKKE